MHVNLYMHTLPLVFSTNYARRALSVVELCWKYNALLRQVTRPALPGALSPNIHSRLIPLQSCELAVHYSSCHLEYVRVSKLSITHNAKNASMPSAQGRVNIRCTTSFTWQTDTWTHNYTDNVVLNADRCSAGDLEPICWQLQSDSRTIFGQIVSQNPKQS